MSRAAVAAARRSEARPLIDQSHGQAASGFESMEHNYTKRGYLLPEGCKDLIDVLKRKQKPAQCLLPLVPKQGAKLPKGYWRVVKPRKRPHPLPPVKGEIIVPDQTSVSQLAALLGRKPFMIVADLIEMGVYASVWQLLDFETISRVARKYGFVAKNAA